MNFNDKILNYDREVSEKRDILFKEVCCFLFEKNLDIVVRSSKSSDDEGGSSQYNEFYLVDKSVLDILKTHDFEKESEETSEETCDEFGVSLSIFHGKVKGLDFGISLGFLEECIFPQSSWDDSYSNYFVTKKDGSLIEKKKKIHSKL